MSETLLQRHDALLLDLDGTVYHGARAIPGAVQEIERARRAGNAVQFVTNNASKTPQEVADNLVAMGVLATADEVRTSAQAAARVLGEKMDPEAPVLVLGTDALTGEMRAAGLRPVREAGADGTDVRAVVQGHSPDTGWRALAEACMAIRAGALWLACNVDTTLPAERGLLPGNGALVAALRAATGAEPLVAGKPEPPLFQDAAAAAGAAKPLVVGDRLDTDIAGAVAAGHDSLVVLTGVATPATLLHAEAGMRPRYLATDLGALGEPADTAEIRPQPGWRVEHDGHTLTVSGCGDSGSLALLRALCHEAWQRETTTVAAADDSARAALADLGLDRVSEQAGSPIG
jgi:glycerol 3-phosphatase-2